MDEQVAQEVINQELGRLRAQTYESLVALIGRSETKEVVGEDGRCYQVEIQAFWDSAKGGDVRVMVAADDFGPRAFMPLSDSFIMSPHGSVIGEPFSGPIPNPNK